MNFFTSRLSTLKDFFSTQKLPGADSKNLFSWDFWTESNLESGSPYYLFIAAFVILVCVALIWWRRQLKKENQEAPVYEGVINQLANIIAFIIIVGLSYIFFRSQQIAYVSSRLVILASIIIVVIWSGWVMFVIKRQLAAKRLQHLEKDRYFRYLPKKKQK